MFAGSDAPSELSGVERAIDVPKLEVEKYPAEYRFRLIFRARDSFGMQKIGKNCMDVRVRGRRNVRRNAIGMVVTWNGYCTLVSGTVAKSFFKGAAVVVCGRNRKPN